MQCSCGSEANESSHQVKTIITARDYSPKAQESDLPLTISHWKCKCGKRLYKAFNKDRILLHEEG